MTARKEVLMSHRLFTSTLTLSVLAGALAVQPASAQFGGLAKKLATPAVGGDAGPAPSVDPDAFVADSLETAKMVAFARFVLDAAGANKLDMAGMAIHRDQLDKASNPKELKAVVTQLVSDDQAVADKDARVANIQAKLREGSGKERTLVAAAVLNFGVGMARNVRLVNAAPGLVSSMTSNPMMMAKLGRIKDLAEILRWQAGNVGGFMSAMPTLITAAKVKMPADPQTSKAADYSFD